jgi:hypothetical protein
MLCGPPSPLPLSHPPSVPLGAGLRRTGRMGEGKSAVVGRNPRPQQNRPCCGSPPAISIPPTSPGVCSHAAGPLPEWSNCSGSLPLSLNELSFLSRLLTLGWTESARAATKNWVELNPRRDVRSSLEFGGELAGVWAVVAAATGKENLGESVCGIVRVSGFGGSARDRVQGRSRARAMRQHAGGRQAKVKQRR